MVKTNSFSMLTTAVLLLITSAALSQTEASGKVTNDYGAPLAGATVRIKGLQNGTVTDAKGNFQMTTTPDSTSAADARSDQQEAVITGFPIRPKRTIAPGEPPLPDGLDTDAAAFLGNFHHPWQILQGRIPGLIISRPGGNPLGLANVQLRGAHSILGATEPLIVVDGLPGASLHTIDPMDIANIKVLRDAASAAMYGARGANGVIEITTRRGRATQALQVSYHGYAALENTTRLPDVLSADTYRRLANDAAFPHGNPTYDLAQSTDWAQEITRTGLSQGHHLALAGGYEDTRYRLSLNFRNVNGVATGSGFNQGNALLNVSQGLFKNKLQLHLGGGLTQRHFTDINKDIFYYAALMNPTTPVRDNNAPFGGYYQPVVFDLTNPVALLEQIQDKGRHTIANLNLGATWQIFAGLDARIRYSTQQQDYERDYTATENAFPLGQGNFTNRSVAKLSNQFFEAALTYQYQHKDHSLRLTGGYAWQDWTNDIGAGTNYDLRTLGITLQNVPWPVNKQGAPQAYKTTTALAAFFGNAQYTYRDWLTASVSVRREGSSRFGDNYRYGSFPAVGAGLDFARLAKLDFAERLNLRAGYGIAGNLPTDGIFANRIFRQRGTVFYNGEFIPAYGPGNNANADLKWEERREFNIGLDFLSANQRLSASLDFYNGRSNDLIYSYFVPTPPHFFERQYENMIDFANHGLEIMLWAAPVRKERFAWEIGFNLGADRTSVDAIRPSKGDPVNSIIPAANLGAAGCCFTEVTELRPGQPLGRFVAWEVASTAGGFSQPRDRNGDGLITAADFVTTGNGLPRFTYGITNSLRLGAFDLNFLLRGASGHSMVNLHRFALRDPANFSRYNLHAAALEPASVPATMPIDRRFVENASFIRLENLVLSWRVLQKDTGGIASLQPYVAVQHLFTLTNYSGPDPDVRLSNGQVGENFFNPNPLLPGLDTRMVYYPTRTFAIGVQAVF